MFGLIWNELIFLWDLKEWLEYIFGVVINISESTVCSDTEETTLLILSCLNVFIISGNVLMIWTVLLSKEFYCWNVKKATFGEMERNAISIEENKFCYLVLDLN